MNPTSTSWLDEYVDADMDGNPITRRMCIERDCGRDGLLYVQSALDFGAKRFHDEQEAHAQLQARCYEGYASASDGIFDRAAGLEREVKKLRDMCGASVREYLNDAKARASESAHPMPVGYQRLVNGKWEHCSAFVALGFSGKLTQNFRAVYAHSPSEGDAMPQKVKVIGEGWLAENLDGANDGESDVVWDEMDLRNLIDGWHWEPVSLVFTRDLPAVEAKYECRHPNCDCDGIDAPPCRAEHANDLRERQRICPSCSGRVSSFSKTACFLCKGTGLIASCSIAEHANQRGPK